MNDNIQKTTRKNCFRYPKLMSPLNKWYCPGLNNSLWWCSKLNIKKWNAILYKTNTYIFALRKTTTELTVNNIFISILFDFRIWIIQHGTVAMAISAHGSFGIEWHVFLIENTFFYLLMSEWSKYCLALFFLMLEFQQINKVVPLSVVYY